MSSNIPNLEDDDILQAIDKAKEKGESHNSIGNDEVSFSENNVENQDKLIKEQNQELATKKLFIKETLIFDILKKEGEKAPERERMRNVIIIFLFSQLLFLALLMVSLLISKGTFGSFNDKVFLELIDFLKFYITVIVAEFVAMIFFIVKYIYNNKLIDVLEKWFKDIWKISLYSAVFLINQNYIGLVNKYNW